MPVWESPNGGTRSTAIRLANRLTEASRLHQAFAEFVADLPMHAKARLAFDLTLEELFANWVHHAHLDPADHVIEMRFTVLGDEIRIEVIDDGEPFDPTQHPAPDFSLPLEHRPIGGLGVHMVRQSMDRIEYQRKEGWNHLTLWRRWRT